jgi:hypothetical protein
MTAPNMAAKVCRGMPNQSAQAPYSRVSSMRTSPTSNQTARIGDMGRDSSCAHFSWPGGLAEVWDATFKVESAAGVVSLNGGRHPATQAGNQQGERLR